MSDKKLNLPSHCIIPLEVRDDKEVPDSAKIYIGELNVLTHRFGYLNYSDQLLADMKEVSLRTIQNWHKILEDRHHIKRETIKKHVKTDKGVEVKTSRKLYVVAAIPLSRKENSNKDADTQKSARHSDTQKSACHSDTQKSARINNRTLNNEYNNNVVAIFSCLKEVGISEKLKKKISEEWSEEQVKYAVISLSESNVDVRNPYGWLVDCLNKGGYDKTPKPKDRSRLNKKWAQEALKSFSGPYVLSIVNTYLDFVPIGSVGENGTVAFEYKDSSFQKKVREFLVKLKMPIMD